MLRKRREREREEEEEKNTLSNLPFSVLRILLQLFLQLDFRLILTSFSFLKYIHLIRLHFTIKNKLKSIKIIYIYIYVLD